MPAVNVEGMESGDSVRTGELCCPVGKWLRQPFKPVAWLRKSLGAASRTESHRELRDACSFFS
jgi:hypothetical protein